MLKFFIVLYSLELCLWVWSVSMCNQKPPQKITSQDSKLLHLLNNVIFLHTLFVCFVRFIGHCHLYYVHWLNDRGCLRSSDLIQLYLTLNTIRTDSIDWLLCLFDQHYFIKSRNQKCLMRFSIINYIMDKSKASFRKLFLDKKATKVTEALKWSLIVCTQFSTLSIARYICI